MAGQHRGFTSSVLLLLLPRFIWEGSCWQTSRGLTAKGQVDGQRQLLAVQGLQFPVLLLALSWQRNHATYRLPLLRSEFDDNTTGNFSERTKAPHLCQKSKSGSTKRFAFCSAASTRWGLGRLLRASGRRIKQQSQDISDSKHFNSVFILLFFFLSSLFFVFGLNLLGTGNCSVPSI